MKSINHIGRVALVVTVAVLLGALTAATAQARKIGNPGPVSFVFKSGSMKVGNETFDAADEDDPIVFQGTASANGAIVIPNGNIQFQPFFVDGPLGEIEINIRPVGDATGNLNANQGMGQANLTVRFYIDIDGGGVGSNCRIGQPNNPIVLNLTTETSGSQTGVRYNTGTGTLTLVDGLFAVPGASGCSTFPINVNNEINNRLGLPSPSGNNFARLNAATDPKLQPGVTAALGANPSTGLAPLTTSFSGAGSTGTAPLTYQWDFTNNNSIDATGLTASFTYPDGVHTVRLRVVDADGDVATATRTIIANRRQPDATIVKETVGGSFVTGATHEFTLDVSNTGSKPTEGPLTVTDQMPAGLTYAGFSGTGWSCDGSAAPAIVCTYADLVADGAAAPQLTLQVVPDGSVLGPVENTATVATADDPNASNNSSSATATIVQAGIDLALHKSHDAEDGLLRGQRATYVLRVRNDGTLPTTGRIRIADTLPDGVTYVSASGPGWTCLTSMLPLLRCFTDDVLDAGEAAGELRVRVEVDSDAPDLMDNTATVTTDGDGQSLNNSSTDHGFVSGYGADFEIVKTHDGEFLAGERGDYTIRVRNVGTKIAGGEVMVTDDLPAGLVPTTASSAGGAWSCGINGQVVLCTHPGPVEPDVTLEAITIGVDVTDAAVGEPVNVARVVSADDANDANDESYDPTVVRSPRPDLAIDKSHAADRFTAGQQGTYRIEVTNTAPEPTRGTITVTDELPAGLGFVSAAGTDWSCGASGNVVTCTRDTAVRGGDSSVITLVVSVDASAAPGVTNVATVAAANDTNPANNRDEDPTAVAVVAAPTTLEADGAILTVYRQGIQLRTGLDGLKATLLSKGAPVVGRRIEFFAENGTPLCSGVTDREGAARCGTLLLTMTQATLGANYSAVFSGDEQYAPSSALGGIIALPRIRVL